MIVPSSISNSNDRLPRVRWLRVYALALCITASLLLTYEAFWRSRGFVPSVNDDALLWSIARKNAIEGPSTVAIVGGSRSLVGIDLDVFYSRRHLKGVQLAIDGNSGIPVLEHLSRDASFRGIVICDLMEEHLRALTDLAETPTASVPEQYIKTYEQLSTSNVVERHLRTAWQQVWASRSPALTMHNIASHVRRGELPSPLYLTMRPDRSARADYLLVDARKAREARETIIRNEYARNRPMTVEEFVGAADRLEEMASRIRARGGAVVFLRMPTTGTHWELDQARYPKREYWDRFARQSSSRTVHFLDHPTPAGYDCPDGSHLDARDVGSFTSALVDIVGDLLPAPEHD